MGRRLVFAALLLALASFVVADSFSGTGEYSLRAGDGVVVDGVTVTLDVVGIRSGVEVGQFSFVRGGVREVGFVSEDGSAAFFGVGVLGKEVFYSTVGVEGSFVEVSVFKAQVVTPSPSPTPKPTVAPTARPTPVLVTPAPTLSPAVRAVAEKSLAEGLSGFVFGVVRWLLSLGR